jgi:hypothetical protein
VHSIPARFREWLNRRRSFAQEFAFRRERAAYTGHLPPRRRDALRHAGADLAGLLQLLLPHRSLHTAWILPLSLFAALVLLYALNPGRQPVWQTVTGTNFAAEVAPSRTAKCTPRTPPVDLTIRWHTADPCVERAPWVQPATIPAAFGKAASWIIVLVGGWPLLRLWGARRVTARLALYGLATLLLWAAIAATTFVTVMQFHSLVNYPHWGLRLTAYVSYAFAHTIGVAYIFRRWRRDVDARCPSCLESLRMPLERGHLDSLLIDPPETESVCIQGHGTLTETRWDRRFQDSRSFWEDLAGTSSR